MNFLISSLQLNHQPLSFHQTSINNTLLGASSGRFNVTHFSMSMMNGEISDGETYFDYYDEILCLCANSHDSSYNSAARSVAHTLILDFAASNVAGIQFRPSTVLDHSCVLLDSVSNYMWLVADAAGTTPLWYAMSDTPELNYVATTDLFAAYHLGFRELTPLGPGQILSIDLTTNELVTLYLWLPRLVKDKHKQSDNKRIEEETAHPGFFARTLLSSVMSVLDTRKSSPGIEFMAELDELHSMSQMVDCAADVLRQSRAVRKARALVVDQHLDAIAPLFETIIGPVEHAMEQQYTKIREASLRRIAVERWHICAAAASTDSKILVSFESGWKPRPLAVYLQNMFCPLLGVTITYPLSGLDFQKTLYAGNAYYRDSYIHQSVHILEHSGVCALSSRTGVRSFDLNTDLMPCVGAGCVDYYVRYSDAVIDSGSTAETVAANGREHEVETCSANDETCNAAVADSVTNTSAISVVVDNNREVLRPNTTSKFESLWRVAQAHASPDKFIFLLLATSGYADLLENFLISVQRLSQPDGSGPIHYLLIITSDVEIVELATKYGVGCHLFAAPDLDQTKKEKGGNSANFGTLSYQQLILHRTECAMDLLLMGFNPIIADIDAVWMSDPLLQLEFPADSSVEGTTVNTAATATAASGTVSGTVRYDIGVTDDHGEVCGCFVVLICTDKTVRFWSQVQDKHRNLITNALASVNGSLGQFSDSEQKILTDMLYKKSYQSEILVRVLNKNQFPSGYNYFNLHSTLSSGVQPAVVHNNFIIGKEMKITRFQRYGLWMTSHTGSAMAATNSGGLNSHSSTTPQSDSLSGWRQLFHYVYQNTSIPSITVVLPIHSTIIPTTAMNNASEHIMVQVSKEGRWVGPGRGLLTVHLDNDPTTVYSFDHNAVFSIAIHNTGSISTVMGLVEGTSLTVSADMGLNRTNFASDKYYHIAHERMLKIIRERGATREVTQERADQINSQSDITPSGTTTTVDALQIIYHIKVLAMKRPESLQRLLESLSTADYGGRSDVSLEIIVDGHRSDEEQVLVEATAAVADGFVWPHGEKRVTKRARNFGMASQWFNAWSPQNSSEVSFIFEDDTEVSPYYFTWAAAATQKYYAQDTSQQSMHRELLKAVRRQVIDNNVSAENGVESPLEEFDRTFAGEPLMYGLSLQQQHVDLLRYPQRLDVRNGRRPFLYSTVGSWGPLMFPIAWQAFKEWWQWRSHLAGTRHVFEPLTETLVVNRWYRANHNIWTPWIVRFAYETGAKCLYSNLPHEYALVINYRMAGENYPRSLGASGALVDRAVLSAIGLVLPRVSAASGDNEHRPGVEVDLSANKVKTLRWSLLHLPELSFLAQWQYDFHLRRPGALGVDRGFYTDRQQPQLSEEMVHAYAVRDSAVQWYNEYEQSHNSRLTLTTDHWLLLADMLEAHLLPDARVLHVGVSPLWRLLSDKFLAQTLFAAHCETVYVDSVTSCVTSLEGLSDHSFDIVIVNLESLLGHKREQLWNVLQPAQYILVLDVCSSAPTDIDIYYGMSSATQNSIHYTAVEDVCTMGASDHGGVLYRLSTRVVERFALSKRLQGGLISRKVVDLAVSVPLY